MMTAEGRFTKDKFGFTLPLDSPLYPKPPVFYRDMDNISVAYETDEDAALGMLPAVEGLELVRPATARVMLARMPFTTFGAYEEMYQLIDVTWQGMPAIYPVQILLNQESALAAGRELWETQRSSDTSSGPRRAKSTRAPPSAPEEVESARC